MSIETCMLVVKAFYQIYNQLEDGGFTKKIIFSYEVYFHLSGFATIGARKIFVKFWKEKCIHNGLLSGMHFGQRAVVANFLDHITAC